MHAGIHGLPGDSGGPLFAVRDDGTREVFGVLSGNSDGRDTWADLTRPELAQWIIAHAAAQRTLQWKSSHNLYDPWLDQVSIQDFVGTPSIPIAIIGSITRTTALRLSTQTRTIRWIRDTAMRAAIYLRRSRQTVR